MGQTAKPPRQNRTLTVDFHNETTYCALLSNTKAFIEYVLAFILSLGFQLTHKASAARVVASHATRITSRSVWAGSPSGASSVRGVMRSSPSCRISSCAIARCIPTSPATPWWPPMGASVWSGVPSSAMSPRWRSIASCVRSDNRVLWSCSPGVGCRCRHLSWPMKSPVTASPRRSMCPRSSVAGSSGTWATPRLPVQRLLPSRIKSFSVRHPSWSRRIRSGVPHRWLRQHHQELQTLFPGARLGNCLRHALMKLPKKLAAIASPVRRALRSQFHTLWYRARQRKGLRVFALGQRLRRFADHVTHTAGTTNGERVRRWFQDKKAGWYAVLADPQMPVTSTWLNPAHNAIERKLFAMKGFHHPSGSQQAFLTGLAHLYNLVPYQRRAQHAGQCGVEVEGGRVPTRRLVPQSANPHLWRLSLTGDVLHH